MTDPRPARRPAVLAAALSVAAGLSLAAPALLAQPATTRPADAATVAPEMKADMTQDAMADAPAATGPAVENGKRTTESGLTIVTVDVPDGPAVARAGDQVWVHYTGKLEDGSTFDSSLQPGRGQPISFPLGAGRVIKGWDEGIAGMRVGERRQLIIPPTLAYGDTARPGIPANSTLIFDVQLVGVYNAEADAPAR